MSFVYDVADLYKAETTIPAAFEAVKTNKQGQELAKEIRMKCRTYFAQAKILSRIANDIGWVLQSSPSEDAETELFAGDLWDDENQSTAGGQNYGKRGGEN